MGSRELTTDERLRSYLVKLESNLAMAKQGILIGEVEAIRCVIADLTRVLEGNWPMTTKED